MSYISDYDKNGKLIHFKDFDGFEMWYEYDSNENMIHLKTSNGYEKWHEYDTNGNCIHYKDSNGVEWWHEYDENGKLIHSKDSNGVEFLGNLMMKNGMGIYTQEAREAAARKHGEPIEYVNELMDALGGQGEFSDPDIMVELWGEFSEHFDATWLIPSGSMMGNFAAWLINRKLHQGVNHD